MPVQLSVDQQALQSLGRALSAEVDGKKLRRELAKNIRAALEPAKEDVRSSLMAMGSIRSGSPPLRSVVSSKLQAQARLTGRSTGAKLRIRKTPGVRDFANAPKRLNRKRGWRRRVFGQDVWVHQVGEPDFFDRPTHQHKAEYRKAILDAMEAMAQRIARKV